MGYEMILIGASSGGFGVLQYLVGSLGPTYPIPVVIVQHRHRQSHLLAQLLQDSTALDVRDAEDKAPVLAPAVHIAPSDYHLLVEGGYFALSVDEPVRHSRPSIDVTFASAADSYGATAAGIVVTGANADGSRGLRRLADRGGTAIVQRPETAEFPTMPAAAILAVPEARAMTLEEIASFLREAGAQAANAHPAGERGRPG